MDYKLVKLVRKAEPTVVLNAKKIKRRQLCTKINHILQLSAIEATVNYTGIFFRGRTSFVIFVFDKNGKLKHWDETNCSQRLYVKFLERFLKKRLNYG